MTTNLFLQKIRQQNNNLGQWRRGFYFMVISILFVGQIVLAESVFTFSTDVQTVALSEISGPITVHSETPVSETTYITLNTTSSTGQFFSSKTSTEPINSGSYIYISSGNSNRTFYYKDTVGGDYIITASIYSKDKTQNLATIKQNIKIGETSGTIGSGATTDKDTSSGDDDNSSAQTNNFSAHSSPSALSDDTLKMDFEISAGRDRLSSVGNNILFKVIPTKLQNISANNIAYFWSFGDGTFAYGDTVNHSYRFAGEYNVVCNATFSDKQAVSRISVKVIEPKLVIAKIPGGIEISNNSSGEINLEDWKMVGTSKVFTFPKDTLLANGKKVIFADETTGLNSGQISLENPLGKKFSEIIPESITTVLPDANFDSISAELKKAKEDLNQISVNVKNNIELEVSKNNSVLKTDDVSLNEALDLEEKTTKTEDGEVLLNNAATVFVAPKSTGFVNTIFAWPIAGVNFVRGLFTHN